MKGDVDGTAAPDPLTSSRRFHERTGRGGFARTGVVYSGGGSLNGTLI